MIVVSDTSPVLNLARIGRLDLLALLYREVLIPSAVYEELIRSKSDLPPAIDLGSQPWLVVANASDQKRVQELREDLDAGEAEAIVLAIERRADLLLVDERRGRRVASAAGLAITGIASAKRAGLIDLARPVLDELSSNLLPHLTFNHPKNDGKFLRASRGARFDRFRLLGDYRGRQEFVVARVGRSSAGLAGRHQPPTHEQANSPTFQVP